MGSNLLDQYTLLHFAVGIVAYFWNISLFYFFIGHTIFEISENTSSTLSAIGSRISPSSEVRLCLRARKPSKKSVKLAKQNKIKPSPYISKYTIKKKIIGPIIILEYVKN